MCLPPPSLPPPPFTISGDFMFFLQNFLRHFADNNDLPGKVLLAILIYSRPQKNQLILSQKKNIQSPPTAHSLPHFLGGKGSHTPPPQNYPRCCSTPPTPASAARSPAAVNTSPRSPGPPANLESWFGRVDSFVTFMVKSWHSFIPSFLQRSPPPRDVDVFEILSYGEEREIERLNPKTSAFR